MIRQHVVSGIDRLGEYADLLKGKRIGLMTNPTGVNRALRSTIDIVRESYQLTALYAVEHGIRGDAQAGDAIASSVDEETGITVYSAYGETSHFTDEMLEAFDTLVFDIQDVGARFYTYIYSLAYAMEACSRAGKEMIVLDRINPIGGVKTAGVRIDPKLTSFVGDYGLVTQYALTIGEYARYVHDYLKLTCPLTVVPLSGWERSMYLDDTDLPWVMTSPNCQNLDAALCYIGTCIFEGTNISEGRGTTIPFQTVGAPFIEGAKLEKHMNALGLPGVHFRRMSFSPTFSKHQGEICHGVQMHITDREKADVFASGLMLLDALRSMYPDRVEFLRLDGDSRYILDKLLGTDAYREGSLSAEDLVKKACRESKAFQEETRRYYLY
ncbi:MAG: DUF1343 domain-containing protein [Clostridia bacterium]|nr:DUF1343 domain-containing protein [Clostridia bacterium]